MKTLRTLILVLWLLVGIALAVWAIWSAITAWQYFHFVSSGVTAPIWMMLFAVVAMVGSIDTWRGKKRGVPMLHVISALGLIYVVVYFLFDGLGDARNYLPWVAALCVLAVSTIVVTFKEM